MTLRQSSSQQRIEGTGKVPQGPWTSATYGRANGIVTVTSIAHKLNDNDELYVKPGSDDLLRTFAAGNYTITVVDEDTFSITGTGTNFIAAATTISYRSVRSLVINASDKMEFSIGSGADEEDAIFVTKSSTGNVRVGINNTNPEFDLDVEGQIRTTRSIISDTAQIRNLDVTNEFVTKGLDLRGPNLINFEETDPTAADFGTIYYPTADNPPRQTQNNRVATTKFVYDVATADNGGRVYVSSVAGIGDDANDGRSAAKPVRTIKKAAQIAYSLQQDTQTPEYVSIICSGGDYVEDNPISLPFNCSLIGDNLRRVILRPLNMDRHMIKASNETYCAGVVFRDHLDANGSPDFTWKFAYVFDDKQRLMYEPDLEPFEFSPGLENKGRNIFAITFENHTGDNTTLLVGYAVEGGSSSSRAIIETVTFTGPQASPYSSGTITVLMSDDESTFQLAERLYYADVYANIVKTGASPSDSLDVADRESQRPETEVIKHQRYQWVINSETETLRFDGSNATIVDATTNQITVPLHRLNTGFKVEYAVENEGGTAPAGLVTGTTYFVRSIDENTLELYDTAANALNIQTTTGRRDLGDPGTGDEHTLFTSRISVKDNTFYFPKHGLFTGNGAYYRSSKAGDIGGLTNNGLYYVYKIDDNYFQLAQTQADATNTDISGADAPVILSITGVGKGYHRLEKALNVVDISQINTDLATQQQYLGIAFEVTGASRTIEGIPFVGHDYEKGQEVQIYGLPYTAIDFGSSASATFTQAATTLTVTVANTDPSKLSALWPQLVTLAPTNGLGVGVHITFDTGTHQDKSFHIATYKTGTLAQAQSDFSTILGGSSNLGCGVARYNSSTNEVYFVIRASDSATRSGNCNVLDNLGDFNGRKYVTHRIERADGYSLKFAIRGSCSKIATDFDPSGDQQVCSATNYALMSLRNSPYAFEKVEFGADFKEMSKQRDGAETINNNLDFIALESYAHVKKANNAGTSATFTRTGTYTCSGDVMTIVCPRGHAVFAKNAYSMVFSGATPDGSVLVDDVADHRTATVILSGASTDSGTVVITVPAPWQTPNSVPPVDRSADGTSLILANKQFIAQEAVDRMLAANPSYNVPTGSQACIDDIVDYCEAMGYNLAYGGNDQVWDGAKYYVDGSHVVGEENESVETFNHARDIAIQIMRNEVVTVQGGHGLTQIRDITITPDAAGSGQGNKHADARNLIWANRQFIADVAVGRMNADFGFEVANNKVVDAHDLLIANKDFIAKEAYAWELAEDPTLHVPTGNGQDCIDDIADIVDAIAFNVQHGGNNKVWKAAEYYVGTPHLDDEEFQSVRCIEHAREICKLVIANNEVVVRGDHGETQTFDLTITHDSSNSAGRYTDADCTDVRASIDTLFEIIHSAILNDSLNQIKKTTPRTFNVPSPQKRTAQDAVYNPATGLMTVTVNTDVKQVSAASFTPASGLLELNIGSHTLTTSDSIRIKTGSLNFRCDLDGQATDHYYPRTTIDTSTITTGTTYNPVTGAMSVTTTAGHGLTDGDWIRFKDNSITWDCAVGTGSHSYPRATDPVSGKWLQVSNTGGLTFDINVGISSNTSAHTFVSAVANGLEKKRDRAYEQDLAITAVSGSTITVNVGASSDTSTHVFQNALSDAVILSHGVTVGKYLKIATDSMTWTCDMDDGNTTHTYPRASDPANGDGWSPVVAVGVNTIDINVGPTTVDGYDVRDAAYNPTTGIMTANIGTNNFGVGQYMRLAPDSLGFTCTQDGNVSTKYYPRSALDTDTVESANYQPSTGVMIITASNHGLQNGDQVKFATDSITFTCLEDNNGTNHSYPRATDYANDRWLTVSSVSTNNFSVQVLGIGNIPSTNTTAHTFVSATTNGMSVKKDPLYDTAVEITAISDSTLTATNAVYVPTEGKITITSANHGLREDSMVKFADDSITFTCDHDSNATNHSYPRAERKKFTVTDATYNTATGIVTCTFANHGMLKGEYIKVKDNALSFSCTHGDQSTKTYPRSTDPISGKFIPLTAVSTDTFSFKSLDIVPSTNTTVHTFVSAVTDGIIQKDPDSNEFRHVQVVDADTFNVCIATSSNETTHSFVSATANGITVKDTTISFQTLPVTPSTNTTDHTFVPNTGITPTDAAYNPTTGWMTLTKTSHGLVEGDYVKVDQGGITFTCAQDSNVTNHAYPRPGDPIFNKSVKIERVTNDTFEFNALQGTTPTNTTAHVFVSATTGCINRVVVKSGGDFPHRFISATSNGVEVSGTNDDCKDDVVDILQVVSWNLAMGGNDFTYDAANMYVTGAHLEGEEHHSIYALREAQKVAIEVFQNQDVTTGGHTSLAQVKDLTITQDTGLPICNVVISSITTLMNIVEVAIDTGSLSSVSRTLSYTNRCADVASSITTLTGIITQAIGTTGSPGNLQGITRTYPIADDQCIDDVRHVLRSWMYDLRYGGNSQTILAASKYILGTNINYVNNEVAQTRAVYQKAKDMAVLAIRNQLPEAEFTDIIPFHNASSTVDINKPECGAAITALTALHTILDNALATPTSLAGVTNTPPSTMLKDDSGLKKVPMLGDLLDLPVIEASPYIQNASLISFLGASGAEIDGNKVAEPNVPRPGVYTDANGRERATFPRQGKSMVANAFTIISVGGGIGYNILNDGYTQLVSVFVIFGGDGVVVQSGGYASLTNSASNFGTRALKATGFRSTAYEFDIGTVTNVINQTDNNGAQTGRQIIEVGGTTLTNFPIEDYIIKFDGYTNTDPAKEYFILGVEKLSGSIGTQVTANVTTNDGLGLDLNETATGNQIAFSQGNLDTLVGKTIRFHRPSVCNSSSHTWEYCGAGDTYLALPQNGGVGIPANEAVEEAFGQVYTSGTNEFGDFKVGDFVTIFNRTGSISFVGTVSISELSSIKIVGGSITITGFSDSDELGGAFASDSLLPTQAAVKDYITNKLGPYLNQPFSTNAVPSALVQLTTSGKINIEQIPALRPFNITSVASTAERLGIEDASAGDIAIETTSTSFTFAPAAVDTVNNYITIVGHGLATGDILTYFQGTANIGNLADGAQYYVIVHSVGANTTDYIKLATSLSDAQAGTARNLAGQGAGTHTLRTEGAAISYILENDLDSMFIAFTPDATLAFTNSELVTGSASGAQGIITNYDQGVVRDILVDETGAGYTGPPGITISAPGGSGTQATATCTVVNGQVSTVTITNKGSGYFSQPTVTFTAAPTGGTTATAQGNVARIEARLAVDLANNIKFSNVDFMQDETNATVATGTYVHDTYDITVTETNHGFSQGDIVFLQFTSGSSPSGFYDTTPVNANEYKVTAAISLLTSGNYERKKIVDVIRTVNTSASDAANWTQLSSTNIDASNIVAGTIDPERLADTGTANSFTFLRGDSSYQNVIQSIKFSTADCMVGESSLSDTSYIEKVDITVAGSGYTVGTYQNIPMLGGNVSIANAGVARATYTVADVTTGGIILSTSNLNQTPESYTPSTTFDVNASTTTGAGLGAQIRFVTDGVGTLSVDLILDGGSGYLGGDTLTFDGPLFGGTVQQPVDITVSTLTSSQAFGVITSVSVVTPGTGYTGDFILTVPNELGTPSQAATLNAKKGVQPRYFGNSSIDIRKANKLTPTTLQAGGSVFGNYGITKFRKNRAEQALGDQTEGGFIVTDNGEVSIDQGAGSKLNADKLDGNEGAFYQNASNLVEGVIDPQRLANTTYNISISGTADFANVLFAETTAPSSANANLVSAANVGAQLALRSNNVNGIPTDAGGDRNGTLTFRRSATGNSVAQLAFSATDNIYLRGNSDLGTVYGNWAKIWHSENDGPPDVNEPRRGTLPGPNADFLDNQQGLWYQQGYNIHDQRTVGVLGDGALPTLLGRDKFVANNFYVVSSGEKYQLYIPNFFAATGANPAGNLSAGGTYIIYADDAAINNIGTITIDPGGIVETDDTTVDAKYTVVTGSITFVGAYGNKDIRVFGPNPGSKWTVTSSNLLTTGASQVFALSNTETGALFEMGRAGIVGTPQFDVRSGGLSNDYDVRFEFSGGNSTNGNGLMDIASSSVTINSNTVWHAGNDGVNSQLDAHYVDGYTQNSANVANTLVRRTGSNDINISDLYADQGVFGNTGTTILQLADGNGIFLGKATTNVLSLKGKQNGNVGYIRFGNDSNSFGYNGTYLSYNNVYFRNGRIGIGDSNPGVSLQSTQDAIFGTSGRSANTYVRALAGDSYQAGFEAFGSNQGTGYLFVGQSISYGGGIAYNGDNSPASFGSESADDVTFYRRDNGTDTRVMKYRYNDSTVHFFGQIRSRLAQGSAPFQVDSNTVVSNLNADLLDGYQASNLPYLSNVVNTWISDNGGQQRFFFSNNSHTYFKTGDQFFFRNDGDYSITSVSDGGQWHFHEPSGNNTQTSYRVQVSGDNGLNIDSDSVGLSSGQRSVVLRANGDKTWIDTYGIIKRNRQSISESITINNGDSCFTAGPLTVNNGYTIQIASGGSWVII